MKEYDAQAELMNQYWAALSDDESAPPPAGLDPEDAALARKLRRTLRANQPRPAFRAELLRQQLVAQSKLAPARPDPRFSDDKGSGHNTYNAAFAPPFRFSGLLGRLATAVIVIALLFGSIAVASDLIRRQQSNPASPSTPTPALAQTATATAQPTPCSGPLASWQAAAPLPSRAVVGAAASDGRYLYVVGGSFTLASINESNQLLRYDLSASKWLTLAATPHPFAAAAVVYSPINKKLYVFGGVHGQTAAASTVASDTLIYDPASNSWSSGAAMPQPRVLMAAGYWNGKIYLVGGAASLASPSIMDTTWEYDPLANTWTSRTPRPSAGSGFGFGVIAGHLYLAGGYDPGAGRFTTSTYDYDIAADKWTVRANLPAAINYVGSAVLGSRLYIFGGIDNGTTEQSQTFVYDPAADIWSQGPAMTEARMMPAAASVGNTILVLGGSLSSILLTSTEATTVSCLASATPITPNLSAPTRTPLSEPITSNDF